MILNAAALPSHSPATGMFGRLFGKKAAGAVRDAIASAAAQDRGLAAADRAAEMLSAPSALMQLNQEEARTVVAYMQPHRIPEGTTFIQEGDTDHTDFMLLVLDGEVTIETIVVSRTAPITVTVLGPGNLIGEMGLLDGEPRSASCTAMSDLRCAILTRDALNHCSTTSRVPPPS